MKIFEELGALTAANWKKCGEAPERFPEIATDALAGSRVLDTLDISDVVDWVATTAAMPLQYAKDFGQPPVNVYVDEKFYIQLLFWIDATTSIHEHGFSGVFGVLSGSSVHSRYRFDLTHDLSKELRLGNTEFISSEILHRGDFRTIESGSAFIHALFHLERPSISVVVRTNSLGPGTIQYSYVKPFVALDPFYEDKTINVRLRLLDSLRMARCEFFWKYANQILDHRSYLLLFNTLGLAYQSSREDEANWQGLIENSKSKYSSEIVELMLESIKEEERTRKLSRLRTIVHDPNHRFFLALLLNVPTSDTLLKLVAQQFHSQEPESLVMQWVREMADAGLFLSKCDPRLLDMIDLAMRYKTFAEARTALVNGASAGGNGSAAPAKAPGTDMEAVWNSARAIHFFQPLFKRAS
jgi:hypothetical protein